MRKDRIIRKLSDKPICGIYSVTNKINNKIYIGQSIDIERRWNQHKYGKGNLILKNAIKKYGIENFQFDILETMEHKDGKILTELEQKWFDIKKPFIKENGYNIQKTSKPNITPNKDRHFGELISKIKIDNNHTGKPINQYDLEGNFIKEWPSSASVERELGFIARNISGCAKGECFTSNGFIWKYKNDILTKEYLLEISNKRPKEKKVYQYNLNCDLINTYNSVKEASELTGFNYGCISHTCRGGWYSYRKFKWSYDLLP